jgi:hypothetical protein
MIGRKPFATAHAALVGIIALFISFGAFGVIDLDDGGSGGVIYAKETLTSQVDKHAGYFVVAGNNSELNVRGTLGIGGLSAAIVTVEFTFTGMVLNADLGDLSLSFTNDQDTIEMAGDRALISGGQTGDDHASFEILLGAAVGRTSKAVLAIPSFGISSNGSGSITMTSSRSGVNGRTESKSYTGAVKLGKGLMPGGMNVNPVALVTEKFLKFKGTGTGPPVDTVSVGSVSVGHDAMVRHADTGAFLTGLDQLVEAGTDGIAPADTATKVVYSGNFSFASRVWLSGPTDTALTATCDDDTATLMLPDDDENRGTELVAQSLATVNAAPHLCIAVDNTAEDQMPIPPTAPYLATKTFVSAKPDAAFPPSAVEHPLGRIKRDGTTVYLPYLTQFADYNQRIVIVNRGGDALYTFDFTSEGNVMTTPGAEAKGVLPAGSTTYLSLKYGDLVTIEGSPNRAAATLIVESTPGDIDVLVSQTNAGGSTDTVLYTPRDPGN